MKVLFQAIYNKWDADAALKAAMPGLYNTAAPQDTDMPYGVFLLLSQDPDDTFNTDQEVSTIQFSIFDDNSSPENVCDIYELLKACFDDCVLAAAGYTSVEMTRLPGASLFRDPEMAWHYLVEYRVTLYKD